MFQPQLPLKETDKHSDTHTYTVTARDRAKQTTLKTQNKMTQRDTHKHTTKINLDLHQPSPKPPSLMFVNITQYNATQHAIPND